MTEAMAPREWDTLIRRALVFDGSGAHPTIHDVALAQGKIVARGTGLSPAFAHVVVDAKGKWLMPGLLDIHTHLDLEVEVNPGLGEAVRHGTTTVLVGNCSIGTAFGAQRKDGDDPIVDCFARVESIPKHVLRQCVQKMHWNNTGDYLAHFSEVRLGPNVAPLIPHSMLRIEAMGVKAAVNRQPSAAERQRMAQLLQEAIDQGYIGMSTDSMVFHYLSNDPNKLKRLPTQFATDAELKQLIDQLRAHDRVWQATPDSENPLTTLRRFFWTSGRLYGKPLRLSALVVLDFPPIPLAWRILLGMGRLYNSRLLKGKFHFQALSTNFRMWSNGAAAPIFEELDSTRELIALELEDREGRRKLLAQPDFQVRFREDMESVSPKTGLKRLAAGRAKTSFVLNPEQMTVDTCPVRTWSGETLAAIIARLSDYQASGGARGAKDHEEASAFSRFPYQSANIIDFFLHCLQEYDHEFRWWTDIANTRPDILETILFDDNTLPGFNDSGAHISNLAFYDGNLVTLKSAQHNGIHRVAMAVKRLTRDPADFFGLDVGTLEVGAQADLVLLDPDALKRYDTNSNRKLEYRREFQHEFMVNRSDGVVEQVYINGTRVWEDGCRYTEALGRDTLGRVLTFRRRRPRGSESGGRLP